MSNLHSLTKHFKTSLFMLLFLAFINPLYAVDTLPVNITFDSGGSGGKDGDFSRDDGDNYRLQIKGKKSSDRTFNFGSALKNTDVIVTFDIEWTGGWDDSRGNRDDFEVTITGSAGIDERLENISNNGTKSYSINAKTDSTGKLYIKFYAHSNSNSELIYVDNLKIVSTAPAVPTDLSITSFTDTPDPVDTSADLTYTTVIANSGILATNVKLSFSLSAGTFKSISSGWSCSGTTSINCTKSADFADGGSETVTLVVTAPSTAQTISANVTLSAAQTDSNTANNSATASTAVQKVYEGVDDICYGATTSAGGLFPKTTSLAINNTSGSNLTNANVVVDTSGFALMSNCSIDNGTLGDGCFIASNYSFGSMTLNKAISYDLADRLKSNDANHSVEQVAMFDISSLSNVYATYTKNGKKYRSTLTRCGFKIQESLRDFALRNPEDTRIVQGDIKLIGNTVLCVKDASGKCYNYTGTARNNDLNLYYIDTDSDSTTYNSSSAKIEIPNQAKIVWAAIYTQGLLSNKDATESSDILKEPIFIDVPSMTKFSSIPEVVNIYPVRSGYTYATYTPLNSLIGKKGSDINGFATVANIKCFEGKHTGIGNFGAWTMVLIYEDEAANYKNISVFDGYQYVSSSSKDVTITVEGFLTPKSGDINSTMGLFVGEGDANINGDKLYFEGNAINTTDAFYSSISGVTRNPSYTNNQGIDIQNHDVSSYMTHKQTSASIRLTSTGDFYVPSLITFSTDIYVPEFCYDYAYRQHDIYFTELNDGTKDPKVTGSVTTGVPIEVGLYIKNKVEPDIAVDNLFLSVDINTSQATYIRNTTQLTPINEIYPEDIADSYMSVADGYIHNIPVGSIESQGYFYGYYQINPKVTPIDLPIDVTATFDMTIGTTTIPSPPIKLGKKMSLCTDNNFRYQPAKSIFNMVHQGYYDKDAGGTREYYNLPTQVVNRPGNFKVIALDPNDLDTLINVSTIVAVDLVDLSAFHDSNASCQQLSSAISPRIWIPFNNSNTTSFNTAAIQTAIAEGRTSASDATSFYANARPHTTFRITFNTTNDGNDDLVKTELTTAGLYKILNFTELVQTIGNCAQDVDGNPNNTDTVASSCGNAGNTGITIDQLATCMECVYGYNTKFICSRDNFAIRPEAFSISMNDHNQTNGASRKHLSNAAVVDVASGYKYYTEVNATTHTSGANAKGYTYVLDKELNSFGFSWSPRSTITATNCNDTNNSYSSVKFADGYLETNASINQVGEYKFEVIDKTYTSVDSNPAYMTHHTGANYVSASIPDCLASQSLVRSNNPYSTAKYPTTTFLNGCWISSDHNNTDLPSATKSYTEYKSYKLTLHPYKFDLSTVTPLIGPANNTPGNGSYVYMESVANDNNMSVHLNGSVKALGYNGSELSNFVNGCFAKSVDINLTKSDINTTTTAFRARLHTLGTSGNITRTVTSDMNQTNGFLTLMSTDFVKNAKGAVATRLNLNYDRSITTPLNPKAITYQRYSANCSTPASCRFNADNVSTKTTQGSKEFNTTIRHYYGRTNVPRQRFTGTSNKDVPISYEVYCDGSDCNKSLLADGTSSSFNDDPRWLINTTHTDDAGSAGTVTQKKSPAGVVVSAQPTGNHQDKTVVSYDGAKGYPYVATMQNAASSWLIYNRHNTTATQNEFTLEFTNTSSGWSGEHETNTSTKNNASSTTSRRIMW